MGEYFDSFNPSTGQRLTQIPHSTSEDVHRAVCSAQAAFPGWSSTPAPQRSIYLSRIADLIESRLEEFAYAESLDQGKPVSLAMSVDIPRAIQNFRFFAGAILHEESMSTHLDGVAINYVVQQPLGVAGLISPWNLPLYLLTWKIAPAIATGNTCVCKPSEVTSLTAWLLGSVIQAAQLPAGVVNMVFGLGARAGAALCAHPQVPLVSFTGGTVTGEAIMRAVAPMQKKLSLELGGKNPCIIFADCDLEDCVATTVRSSFTNQGEICLCNSRIFVEESIYQIFVEKFVEASRKLVVGDPTDSGTTTGALVSREHMEKVLSYIQLAREEGGTILLGGDRPTFAEDSPLAGGYFVNPTIVSGLPPTARCQQEEIFGPVVTIWPFKSEADAVHYANDVKYGLSSSVWTRDIKRAQRIALQVQAGTVWINCWLLRDLRTPFGGQKASGVGREGGKFSLDFFTESKTICMKYA